MITPQYLYIVINRYKDQNQRDWQVFIAMILCCDATKMIGLFDDWMIMKKKVYLTAKFFSNLVIL
jgi:hypothetical protein